MRTPLAIRSALTLLAFALAAGSAPRDAAAGPPCVCWAIDVGDATSLPWGEGAVGLRPDYDVSRMADDAMNVLEGKVSVLVRTETLRRATAYARHSEGERGVKARAALSDLTARVFASVLDVESRNVVPAFAWLDAGYLVAARAQAGLPLGFDGYAWALRGGEMLKASAEAQFVLAVMTAMGEENQARHRAHLRAAVEGAQPGTTLARNLLTYFGDGAATLEALRARVRATTPSQG
jgi:hypothetical protein